MNPKKGELLSQVLRKQRLKLGLTQREVGEALGYQPQFVTNWERGKSSPPAQVIPQLAKLLQISEKAMLGVLTQDSMAYWERIFLMAKPRARRKRA